MAYERTKRIAEEVKKVISQMLYEGQIKDINVIGSRSLISVTSVEVVKDLRYAYVYISVLGDDTKEIMEGLHSAAGYVRREVGKAVKLRYTPEVIFRLDDSIEKGAYLSKLITDVNKPTHDKEEKDKEAEEEFEDYFIY